MLFRRIWYLVNRRRLDRELAEEIDAHLAELPPEERRNFGNPLRLREEARDAWGWIWLDQFAQDLRVGARGLRRAPLRALTLMLVLTGGMAVAITGFQVFNAAVLRPLPVRSPETLVQFERRGPESLAANVSYPSFSFVRDHNGVLTATLAHMATQVEVGEDTGRGASARFVSANYFGELGEHCAPGRCFDRRDLEQNGGEAAVVLSAAFWRDQLGADPGVVGSIIRVNRRQARVTGVASPVFTGLRPGRTDLWLLVEQHPLYFPGSDLLTNPARKSLTVFGRIPDGLPAAVVEAALQPAWAEVRRLHQGHVGRNEWLTTKPAGHAVHLDAGDYQMVAFFSVLILLALAVSAANASVLELAHAMARRHEVWVRASLGATRWRIVRQLLAESLVVCAVATMAALGLSYWGSSWILNSLDLPLAVEPQWDWRVAAASAALMSGTALLSGLAPALQLSRGMTRGARGQTALIGVQVAASCVLLIIAGLYVRGLQRVMTTPPGFEVEQVLSVNPAMGERGFSGQRARVELERLANQIASAPGVRSTALCSVQPLSWDYWKEDLRSEEGRMAGAYANSVEPEFFDTMSVRIVRGRVFRSGEAGVMVVSESLARRLWPGEDAVGRRAGERQVVGVAASARMNALHDGNAAEVYFPLSTADPSLAHGLIMVRTAARGDSQIQVVRSALHSDGAPSVKIERLSGLFTAQTEGTRKGAAVIGGTGVAMLLLTAAGIGGLVAFSVRRRTHEIGIHVALGAPRWTVVWLAVAPCVMAAAVGLACGAAGGFLMSGALESRIYGLSRSDAATYSIAAALILLASTAAALGPVARALRINPASALRHG